MQQYTLLAPVFVWHKNWEHAYSDISYLTNQPTNQPTNQQLHGAESLKS